MTVAVSGGSGTITYQWQQSPDGANNWTNSTGTGATTATYTPESTVVGTTYYRVLVNAANSGCDQAVSNTATAIISPDLTITTQPSNLNECVGGTATISVVVSGGSGTITYQWQQSPNGTNSWTNSTGTGNTTPTILLRQQLQERPITGILINASNSGCGQIESNNSIVEIDPDATVTVAPIVSQVCVGANVLLTATVNGGSNTLVIQWQVLNGTWNDNSRCYRNNVYSTYSNCWFNRLPSKE
jgi:hypothetical protein